MVGITVLGRSLESTICYEWSRLLGGVSRVNLGDGGVKSKQWQEKEESKEEESEVEITQFW